MKILKYAVPLLVLLSVSATSFSEKTCSSGKMNRQKIFEISYGYSNLPGSQEKFPSKFKHPWRDPQFKNFMQQCINFEDPNKNPNPRRPGIKGAMVTCYPKVEGQPQSDAPLCICQAGKLNDKGESTYKPRSNTEYYHYWACPFEINPLNGARK